MWALLFLVNKRKISRPQRRGGNKMAHAKGMVVGTETSGRAEVMVERSEACSGCSDKKSCHSCLSHAKTRIETLNIAGAGAGDLVSLSIPTDSLIKGAAALYLVPVIGMLTGALGGSAIGRPLALQETPAAIFFGFAGLFFWISGDRFFVREDVQKPWFHPENRPDHHTRCKTFQPGSLRCPIQNQI